MRFISLIIIAFFVFQCVEKSEPKKGAKQKMELIPINYKGKLDLTKANVVLNDIELGKFIISQKGKYYLFLDSMNKDDQQKIPNFAYLVIYAGSSEIDLAMHNLRFSEKYRKADSIEVLSEIPYLEYYGYEHPRTHSFDSIHDLLNVHDKEWKAIKKDIEDKIKSF